MEHIFGPVKSRRLGFSLGVDLVPFKTCSMDCLYCQIGRTTCKTLERRAYVPLEEVCAELEKVVTLPQKIDYITLSGSGEPTLNSHMGRVISAIKKMTALPVAVLTNGTLLYREEVREELSEADLVLPSFDAVSPEVFTLLNRPHPDLTVAQMIAGLEAFQEEFSGRLWVEVMVVKGINDSPEEVRRIGEVLSTIGCDKIQLNTVVRLPAERNLVPLSLEELAFLQPLLGERCEIIAGSTGEQHPFISGIAERLVNLLSRRPLNLAEISDSLGLPPLQVVKYLTQLVHQGMITSCTYGSEEYYRLKR